MLYRLSQGFSNCGTRTASGTPATVQQYTGIVKKSKDKKIKTFIQCSYIENLIKLIYLNT
jgi:hypothetical protein